MPYKGPIFRILHGYEAGSQIKAQFLGIIRLRSPVRPSEGPKHVRNRITLIKDEIQLENFVDLGVILTLLSTSFQVDIAGHQARNYLQFLFTKVQFDQRFERKGMLDLHSTSLEVERCWAPTR